MQINRIFASKILNSRKEETISVLVESNNIKAEASAPSGKSKGIHEVKDLSEKGIDFSILFINVLGRKIINDNIRFGAFEDIEKVEELVKHYDKTKNFEFIGGNSLYALEAAILKAIAESQKQELYKFLLQNKTKKIPRLVGNCIGGGLHIKQKEKTDWQEFLLIPKTKTVSDASFINIRAYEEAKSLLAEKDKKFRNNLTDENALASTLDNESVLVLLEEVIKKIKEKFGITIDLGVDFASSSFWNGLKYHYGNFSEDMKQKTLVKKEQAEYMFNVIKKHNLIYAEDAFHQEDFSSFANMTKKLKNVMVVGDDLTCTIYERVEKAIKEGSINALIIKPNQAGSLIETKKVVDLAKKNGITTIISHRSGETQDNFISHLAVGWEIPFIKTGILGKERLAKINELIRIEKN